MTKYKNAFDENNGRRWNNSLNLGEKAQLSLQLAIKERAINSSSLANYLGISRQSAMGHLKKLVKHGLMRKQGKGRSTRYIIADYGTISKILLLTVEEEAIISVRNEWISYYEKSDPYTKRVRDALGGDEGDRPFYFFDIKNVIHPAFVTGSDFVITDWSNSFEKLFGRPDERETFVEFFRKLEISAWKLDLDNDRQEEEDFLDHFVLSRLANCKDGRPPHVNKQLIRFRKESKGYIYLEFSCAAQGSCPGLQSIMPIANQRVNMIRQLRMRPVGFAAMKHRISQPMNAVRGVAELLEGLLEHNKSKEQLSIALELLEGLVKEPSRMSEGSVAKLLECTRNASSQYNSLVHQLQDMINKLRRNIMDYTETIDLYLKVLSSQEGLVPILALLVNVCVQLKKGLADERNVKLKWDIPEEQISTYMVHGEEILLREAFFCVLENAIQGCARIDDPSRRIVEVNFQSLSENKVEITISDRGPGIPAEDLRDINKRAKTIDPAQPSDLGMLTGIEVAMATARTLKHAVKYESQKDGRGTIVTFIFPLGERIYEQS